MATLGGQFARVWSQLTVRLMGTPERTFLAQFNGSEETHPKLGGASGGGSDKRKWSCRAS